MDTNLDADVSWLVRTLREADDVVALTGAGMSTASGIPDFRGDEGIWETEFDPSSFNRDRFENDPAGFWRDRLQLHERLFPDHVGPNEGHDALSELESRGYLDAVVTQNTDGLHTAAGSDRVIELHGTAAEAVCESCDARFAAESVFDRVRGGTTPPRCDDCDGILKPAVVLFGERLPRVAYTKAQEAAKRADLLLALGSSLTVHPAAGLAGDAAENGTLAIVNFDSTSYDERAERVIRADLTEVLPAVADRL